MAHCDNSGDDSATFVNSEGSDHSGPFGGRSFGTILWPRRGWLCSWNRFHMGPRPPLPAGTAAAACQPALLSLSLSSLGSDVTRDPTCSGCARYKFRRPQRDTPGGAPMNVLLLRILGKRNVMYFLSQAETELDTPIHLSTN